MTGTTDSVLASIDGALTDYGYIDHGGSAMRWRPGPPEGEDDPCAGGALVDVTALFTAAFHYRTRDGYDVCARVVVYSEADRAEMARKTARSAREAGWRLRPASHCEECNPRGNPGPLPVNGHEYHRRLRNRRKRGR